MTERRKGGAILIYSYYILLCILIYNNYILIGLITTKGFNLFSSWKIRNSNLRKDDGNWFQFLMNYQVVKNDFNFYHLYFFLLVGKYICIVNIVISGT